MLFWRSFRGKQRKQTNVLSNNKLNIRQSEASDGLRYLDEHQSVSQVLVEALTSLSSLQLILTPSGHGLQILPACTANEQCQNEHSYIKNEINITSHNILTQFFTVDWMK